LNTQVVLHLPAHAWEFTEVLAGCYVQATSRSIANEFLDPGRLNPVPPVVCARPKRPSANGVIRRYVGKYTPLDGGESQGKQ
jgi:hypothetical protein